MLLSIRSIAEVKARSEVVCRRSESSWRKRESRGRWRLSSSLPHRVMLDAVLRYL
jgi:hypothetical protein